MPLISQVDSTGVDTAFVLSLYPLQVGNEWRYRHVDSEGDYDEYKEKTWYSWCVIRKDSIIEGRRYYCMSRRNVTGQCLWIRVDSSSLNYHTWDPYEQIETSYYLSGNYDSEWNFSDSKSNIFGEDRKVRIFNDYSIIFKSERCYASGIGMYFSSYRQHGGREGRSELIGCKIDGQEYGNLVGVSKKYDQLPLDFVLKNYPNPFNPTTTISYDLPEPTEINLTVYDMKGREVTTLKNQEQPAGHYEAKWNGVDESGSPVSTGVYFARLQVGDYSKTIKMVYLK